MHDSTVLQVFFSLLYVVFIMDPLGHSLSRRLKNPRFLIIKLILSHLSSAAANSSRGGKYNFLRGATRDFANERFIEISDCISMPLIKNVAPHALLLASEKT